MRDIKASPIASSTHLQGKPSVTGVQSIQYTRYSIIE